MKNLGLLIFLCAIFASAQSSGEIFQFRAKIGFTGPSEKIIAQKFLDEDRKLLLISKETIQLWDIPNFKLLESRTHQIPKLENIDMYVRISPEGTKAIVLDGFSRRIIRKEKKVFATAWDLRNGKQIAVLERPIESIREAAWSEDGSTLVTYSDTFNDKRTEVSFWEGDTLALRSVIMMKGDLGFHKLSRDGKKFFASAQTSTTGIFDPLIAETKTGVWNTNDGKMLQSFISDGQSPYLWSAYDDAIDPRERWFVAGTKGGNLSGWAIGGSNLPEYKIEPTKKDFSSVFRGFSDNGDLLIFTHGKSLMLYDVETGKLVRSYPDLLRKSRGLPLYKLHTDDKTLGVNYCEAADVFDLDAGKKLYELSLVCKERFSIAESYPVDSDLITFHPNKDFLLTVSDKTIRIWNSKNGSLIQTMIAPDRIENKRKDNNKDDGLTRVAGWIADGKYLFAVTADQRSILIWELNDP